MSGLLLALLMALGDEPAAVPAAKPAAAAVQAPDVDRPALSVSEIKSLRDSNIFAPYGRKNPPVRSKGFEKTKTEAPVAPKPKPPMVTGIFFDAKQKCFLVVVEDRNEASLRQFKEPKFLKTGDEVMGLKIGTVTAEKASFVKGDLSKEASVGDAVPGAELKASPTASDDPEAAPTENEDKVEIKPLDTEEKTKVLEKMKKERGKKNRPSNDDQ